ncbi:MAG: tetratricopeptide repeat protein, partial [Planctomycetota bacterium]|nr:tetratricopeptide repeat protein [Planctomycetota bacterium]
GIASREEIRRKEPKNIRNLIRLARLYKDTQQFDSALEAYESAVEVSKEDPEFDEILVTREVARFLGSREVGRPSDGEALLEELQRSRDDSADKARITMILGFFYEEQKRLSKAERLIRMAVSFDDSVEILLGAGEFFGRIFRWSDSLEFYERALKLPNADKRSVQGRIISLLLAQQDLDRLPAEIEKYVQRYPDDPQGLIFQGTFHMMGGDIEKAEQSFSTELEANPNNAVALWQRGQLYVLKGRWRLAIEDLTRAKSYNPDGFSYRHRISLSEALLGADRGDDAISELKSILSEHVDELGVASALAGLYVDMDPPRFGDAEYLITTYMKRNPADENWPLRLGKLGELSQDWDTAIKGYERAAEVSQYRTSVVESLFSALELARRPEKVIRYAEQKLSDRRLASMPNGLATLGWAYAETGRKEAALAAFDRAMSAAAHDFAIHAGVLSKMMSTFRKDEVRARIEARDDEDIHQHKVLLQLLYLRRDMSEAEEVANLIIQQAEKDTDKLFAYVGLAALQESMKRYGEARENYETVLRLDPDNAFALNNLSYILSEKFDAQKESLPYAERAAKLSPRNADVLDTLGWVLFRNGRTGEAVTRLLQALDIDRKNIAAMYHLGMVYKERGEQLEARRWLNGAKNRIEDSPKHPDGSLGSSSINVPMIEEALGEMN